MKTILCFGDSLTFGADPDPNGAGRHAYQDRWPSALEAGLAGKARVIAEGLGGRTTAFDDHTIAADMNSVHTMPIMLKSHQPLDLVVIMLGTNDLKNFVCGNALGAAMGMKRLATMIRTFPFDHQAEPPKIILVSPPHPVETSHENLAPMFVGAVVEGKKLAGHYSRIADEIGVDFFDAATVANASPIDGVHLDAANTRAIGEGLVPLARRLLSL